MKTSLFALGFLAIGLAQCSGDKALFVGDEHPNAGEGGEGNTSSGGSDNNGGASGSANRGGASGSESSGGNGAHAGEPSTGGSESSGGSGSGAEGGEPSTGGVAGTGAHGGMDAGGTAGEGGTAARGGAAGSGAEAGSGTAAHGGMNDGGRAGASTGGAAGASTGDCAELAREYSERLAAVQECSTILTVEQCTLEMPDDFFCPCPLFVNPARESDIRRLNQILESAPRCQRVCPAIACPDPKRGTCSGDATSSGKGQCVNVLM